MYGSVVGYEGRPSDSQVQRADALARELADVTKEFDEWVTRELPAINKLLATRKIPAIESSLSTNVAGTAARY